MRCTSPRTVSQSAPGEPLNWSPKNYNSNHRTLQIQCGKCISCLLEYSRSWSLRCNHEASMHSKNSFITLTYSDSNLKSQTLIRKDFSDFIKRLRSRNPQTEIGLYGCGEYGTKTKRPHFHALLFNFDFDDKKLRRKNKHGDPLYKSETLDEIWGLNDPKKVPCEIGSVSFKSAAYVARYHLKALVHGNRQDNPPTLTFKSKKYTIGKRWLEKNYLWLFARGYATLDNQRFSIPRYYEKWLEKNHPSLYEPYVTQKLYRSEHAEALSLDARHEYLENRILRSEQNPGVLVPTQLTQNEIRNLLITEKTKQIMSNKGD